ncbi:MAG: hypothetical protein E7613_02100 [Ruminococcaceae bacterium]|nr:hypothetical protein [Oscillospiraceae bacterium]
MGYLFFLLSKIAAVIKSIAVKNCGNIAKGAKNSVIINIIRAFGCVIVSFVVALFAGLEQLDTTGTVIAVFAGVCNGVSLFSWVLAVNNASICTVETFCMTGGVVLPLIVSPFIFAGESVSIFQWTGSALLFVAMFCLTKSSGKRKLSFGTWVLLITSGLANFGCVLTKKLFTEFSKGKTEVFQLYTFAFVLATLFIIFLFFPRKKAEDRPKFSSKVIMYIFVAIVMLYTFEYFATLSASYLDSAIYYPLSYIISMPLNFLTDTLVYKEKITLNNIVGIVLVTLSGVLINF